MSGKPIIERDGKYYIEEYEKSVMYIMMIIERESFMNIKEILGTYLTRPTK